MKRSRLLAVLGWGGLGSLLVGTALTVALPYVAGVHPPSAEAPKSVIQLTKHEQRIELPVHQTYGVWYEDADNSGYSIGPCTIVDDHGRPVPVREPSGWTVGVGRGFDDEFGGFEYEFNTGDGKLTMKNCLSSGAETSVRPLEHVDLSGPPFGSMGFALPLIVGTLLIQLGVWLLIAWVVLRLVWKPTDNLGP